MNINIAKELFIKKTKLELRNNYKFLTNAYIKCNSKRLSEEMLSKPKT